MNRPTTSSTRGSALSIFALLLALLSAVPLDAQTTTLTGTVISAESGDPIGGADVHLRGGPTDDQRAVTDAQGRFTLRVTPGTYTLVVTRLGHETRRLDGFRVDAEGSDEPLVIEMRSTALTLGALTVTANLGNAVREGEAPGGASSVEGDDVRSVVTANVVETARTEPGVDFARTGLMQGPVVVRGFNNHFSGSLLVLTDGRRANVPSLRFNATQMIPANMFDVDRIELLRGPSAALYGPNAANGVLHIITQSPLDSTATQVSLAAGERDILQGVFRHAQKVNDRLGFKISGQYFRGDDWVHFDSFEVQAAREAGADPMIGLRDFSAERWSVEGRVDTRWEDGTELIVSGGLNRTSSVEITGLGAGQVSDWTYSYAQARFTRGQFFAQLYGNFSDAGESFLLRTGEEIVDESSLVVAELQHGFSPSERQSFLYGIDAQFTTPRTNGTITGVNEDDDEIREYGAYIHSETQLTDRLKLYAALRIDDHNRLEDLSYSPRAALVYRAAEGQNIRFTFNRAFATPTTNNLFLDLLSGRVGIPPEAPIFGYDIRTRGVPESGFSFSPDCAGGIDDLCMVSALPGSPAGRLPANAVAFWDALVGVVVPEQLQAALLNPGALPTDPAISSVLRRFNLEAAQGGEGEIFPLDLEGPAGIKRLDPTITNTFEAGYTGQFSERVTVLIDVYYSKIRDFVGPLRVETPSVFLDPASTAAFVQSRLAGALQGGLVTPAQVQAIIEGMAAIPTGTVTPDQATGSDLLLTYRNFGDVSLWGSDMGIEAQLDDQWRVGGTFSWVSEECFDFGGGGLCRGPLDIALNAPTVKGSLMARYHNGGIGLTVDGRARFLDGFPMNSGAFVGDVSGYGTLDVNVGYQLPIANAPTVTLSAFNVFDNVHREFVGAPQIGRLLLLRLAYDL